MQETDLHTRLEELGRKIEETSARIKRENHLMRDHHLTGIELKDRYRLLQKRLNEEVANEEAHGHHVESLEKSIREWMRSATG